MSDIAVFIAVGAAFGLLSATCFVVARWNELRSTTGSWEFSVFLLRFAAVALMLVALVAIFNFNLMALFMVVASWTIYVFVRRRMSREALVWILAVTTMRGLPLAPSIQAFALECTGGYRWRVLRFARRLRAGLSLSAALAKDRGVLGGLLTRDGAAAVCVGVACGDLPNALLEAARITSTRRPIWNDIGARLCYLIQLLAITVVITIGMMYFIMPASIKIFEDFDADLPPITILLISLSSFLAKYIVLHLFLLLGGMTMAFILGAMLDWAFPRFFGWRRNRHAPPLMRALAGVVERNQPLLTALAALAESYPSRAIRHRLAAVRKAQEKGESDWQVFADRGLLTSADADVLNAAARVGNLPWAMRTLADANERRQGYRIQIAMQILWPVAILTIGSLVGFIVVAWMAPLSELIRRLA